MIYQVHELALLSGVSARTLRYYDQIGLLKPEKVGENGYRFYGQGQVDTLQQILFYRELCFKLDAIKKILGAPDFDRALALENHLTSLENKKTHVETLIRTVSQTIAAMKGDILMNDEEKFEGFKKEMLEKNEKKYGNELRVKFSDAVIQNSNKKVAGMTMTQWEMQEALSKEINAGLAKLVQSGDPASAEAQALCEKHKGWICMFWADGTYSKEAHKNLGEMYVSDDRFKAYYDKIADGAAQFLCDALAIYCKED